MAKINPLKFKQLIVINEQKIPCQARQIFDRSLIYAEKAIGGQIVDYTYYSFTCRYFEAISTGQPH